MLCRRQPRNRREGNVDDIACRYFVCFHVARAAAVGGGSSIHSALYLYVYEGPARIYLISVGVYFLDGIARLERTLLSARGMAMLSQASENISFGRRRHVDSLPRREWEPVAAAKKRRHVPATASTWHGHREEKGR